MISKINDLYGHEEGDQALLLFCEVLRGCVRQSDIVARYGGEEFVVFMANISETASQAKAEEICKATRILELPQLTRLSVSVGVAWSTGADDSLYDLLERADKAMYVAKRQGKDQVVLAE